ncbi:hypothetical protein [Teredinibacter sp. KSP-S5-2]|uniref:hypothetical protein n=1 Tax=Teredinibacter sp. KSP-S5-2 TaxID=3034506 RepID=UPI0029348798|nr:hypothetical protein [Teredinibacter sp. KSP-S5-2]WNO11118.1 hypothetical protein P5V12_08030 [Teredinibacter sp. KSP-S5-2]
MLKKIFFLAVTLMFSSQSFSDFSTPNYAFPVDAVFKHHYLEVVSQKVFHGDDFPSEPIYERISTGHVPASRTLEGRTPKPSGKTVQVMSFRFRSNNYFTDNSNAHFFIGLRGKYVHIPFSNEDARLNASYNYRGLIIGGLTMHPSPDACKYGTISQVEHAYRNVTNPNGNPLPLPRQLYPNTCTSLSDNTWYSVVVKSHETWISYQIKDTWGNLVGYRFQSIPIGEGNDTSVFGNPQYFDSWLIGEAIAHGNPPASWSTEIKGLRVWWI